jgi:hypothetical protein
MQSGPSLRDHLFEKDVIKCPLPDQLPVVRKGKGE